MIINLLSIVSTDNNVVKKEIILENKQIQTSLGTFPVVECSPFELCIGHVKNNQIYLKGQTSVAIKIACDRCLKPVVVTIDVEIDKEINLNIVEHDEHMIEEKNYIDGYNLDVDKVLLCEILIGWPMKILCCDTCKGVCNVCGLNLNEGTCNCEDTSIDPRMSVIRDVFKNFKEV